MFSQVSVCPQSASWILVHCSALLRRGRYAFYWNAFLLVVNLNWTTSIKNQVTEYITANDKLHCPIIRTRFKENTVPVNQSQHEILFTAQNILYLFDNLHVQHFVNWHSYRCIRVYRHRSRNLRCLDKQWEDLHMWPRRSHLCSLHNLTQ